MKDRVYDIKVTAPATYSNHESHQTLCMAKPESGIRMLFLLKVIIYSSCLLKRVWICGTHGDIQMSAALFHKMKVVSDHDCQKQDFPWISEELTKEYILIYCTSCMDFLWSYYMKLLLNKKAFFCTPLCLDPIPFVNSSDILRNNLFYVTQKKVSYTGLEWHNFQ